MARSRNLKPSFFTNDELAEVEPLGRLLFAGLWTLADRRGRLEDRPARIKVQVLPYDNCDCDDLLDTLEAKGFIKRYVAAGQHYIQIVTFNEHQNPHIKEPESTIPAPDDEAGISTGISGTRPGFTGTSRADSLLPLTDSLNPQPENRCVSGFDEFWLSYPKKKSRGQALKAWKKINPNEQLQAEIQAAVERAKTSEDWKKEGGRFIPHPATWLNAEGWLDQTLDVREMARNTIEEAERIAFGKVA